MSENCMRVVVKMTPLPPNGLKTTKKRCNFIKNFISENIKSPYKEYNYIVQNNDTLEKILKKYKIKNLSLIHI